MTTTAAAPRASFVERHATVIFILILAVAAWLRLREALHTPLWFEEIYIAFASRLPLVQVVDTIGHDIHPPMWYVLDHIWERFGGLHPLWLKALPLLLSLANIGVTYRFAKRTLGTGAALLASAMIALDHSHVRFAQEAQSFAFEWLLVILALNAAWDWIATRRVGSAIAYVVFGALSTYTHYISLAILATVLLWGLWMLRHERGAARRWAGLNLVILLAFLPQFPIETRQLIQDDVWHRGHFASLDNWLTLGRVVAFDKTYLIPVFLLLGFLPLLSAERRRVAVLLWATSVLPIFAVRIWGLNFPREIIYVVPLFLPLVAAGTLMIPLRWARFVVAAGLLIAAARSDVARTVFPEPAMLMQVRAQLDREARPGDVIVHDETHSLLFFRLYDPGRDHRMVWPPDRQVPYYEGGLIVPPAWCIAPASWDSLRASGGRWWAVSLNRAQIVPGHGFTRTGLRTDSLASAVPGVARFNYPPVVLWGSPATRATASRR